MDRMKGLRGCGVLLLAVVAAEVCGKAATVRDLRLTRTPDEWGTFPRGGSHVRGVSGCACIMRRTGLIGKATDALNHGWPSMHGTLRPDEAQRRLLGLRLRGGGLIKAANKGKTEAKKRNRKKKKEGLWWIQDDIHQGPQPKGKLQLDLRLMEACKACHCESIAELIDQGADVNIRRRHGATGMLMSTPLHLTAVGGSARATKLLLELGARVDAVDACKKTPLHRAAAAGHATVCQILLDAGADVHAEDIAGYTPLDDSEMSPFVNAEARAVLQEAGALRYGANSVLNNPGWGGQKARHSKKNATDDVEDEFAVRRREIDEKRRSIKQAYKDWAEDTWGSSRKRVEKARRRMDVQSTPGEEREEGPGRRARRRQQKGGIYDAAERVELAARRRKAAMDKNGVTPAGDGGSSFEEDQPRDTRSEELPVSRWGGERRRGMWDDGEVLKRNGNGNKAKDEDVSSGDGEDVNWNRPRL